MTNVVVESVAAKRSSARCPATHRIPSGAVSNGTRRRSDRLSLLSIKRSCNFFCFPRSPHGANRSPCRHPRTARRGVNVDASNSATRFERDRKRFRARSPPMNSRVIRSPVPGHVTDPGMSMPMPSLGIRGRACPDSARRMNRISAPSRRTSTPPAIKRAPEDPATTCPRMASTTANRDATPR